jgi:hypothetical protein
MMTAALREGSAQTGIYLFIADSYHAIGEPIEKTGDRDGWGMRRSEP